MGVKFKILKNLTIGLPSSRDYLIKVLESTDTKYRISYDKVNNDIRETIIALSDTDTSMEFKDEALCVLRMHDTPTNHIDTNDMHDKSPAILVSKIKDKIAELVVTADEIKVSIETIDTNTMKCRFIVESEDLKCRVSSAQDKAGNIFISTLRLI